jgi:hypothetical protein
LRSQRAFVAGQEAGHLRIPVQVGGDSLPTRSAQLITQLRIVDQPYYRLGEISDIICGGVEAGLSC